MKKLIIVLLTVLIGLLVIHQIAYANVSQESLSCKLIYPDGTPAVGYTVKFCVVEGKDTLKSIKLLSNEEGLIYFPIDLFQWFLRNFKVSWYHYWKVFDPKGKVVHESSTSGGFSMCSKITVPYFANKDAIIDSLKREVESSMKKISELKEVIVDMGDEDSIKIFVEINCSNCKLADTLDGFFYYGYHIIKRGGGITYLAKAPKYFKASDNPHKAFFSISVPRTWIESESFGYALNSTLYPPDSGNWEIILKEVPDCRQLLQGQVLVLEYKK